MPKQPKRGRPKVNQADKRTPYALSLNVSEREAVARAAEAAGMLPAAWCRRVIMQAVEEGRKG